MSPRRAGLLAFAALLAARHPASAESVGERRRRLEALKAQIEAKKQEMEAYKRMQEEIRQDLERLRDEKDSSLRRLSKIERSRRSAGTQKRELTEKLAALTMAEGRGRTLLVGEFSDYARGLQGEAPYYGKGGLWREAYRRAALREKADYLSGLRVYETQTSRARERSLARDRELSLRSRAVQAELRSRQVNYNLKEERYKKTSEQAIRTVQEMAELEDSARALTSLLKGLERRGGSVAAPGAALSIPKYSLSWPAAGRVVTRFGKERVPKLNTWVIHSGIELATEAGAPVQAVESGKVIYAGKFRSYGNVLILDHGRGFFSIYGRLREFAVQKGESVAAAARIAAAGAAGRGGVLYFEIRRGAEALDPLHWLKKQ